MSHMLIFITVNHLTKLYPSNGYGECNFLSIRLYTEYRAYLRDLYCFPSSSIVLYLFAQTDIHTYNEKFCTSVIVISVHKNEID